MTDVGGRPDQREAIITTFVLQWPFLHSDGEMEEATPNDERPVTLLFRLTDLG